MGGRYSKNGGVEVIVSDEHPWGVGDIKMMIPLKFANEMRKEGAVLNKEYKNFLAHRVYELIPKFINLYDQTMEFDIKYANVIAKIMGDGKNIKVESQISVAKVKNSYIDILKRSYDNLLYNPDDKNSLLLHMQIVYMTNNPIMYKYPNYVASEMNDIYHSRNIKGTVTFTNNPYIMSFIKMKDTLSTRKIDPKSFTNWDEYVDKRNRVNKITNIKNLESGPHYLDIKKQIAKNEANIYIEETIKTNEMLKRVSDGKNLISIIPIGWYSFDGAHAVTIIVNSYSNYVYITDSNGVNDEEAQIIYFLKQFGRFQNYTFIPIMPPSSCPRAFQVISEDKFCQTWTILITILVILNDLDITSDINEVVFKEIIEHAKPLIGYYEGMNKRTKLGLIIVEFMFFIYKSFHDEFINIVRKKAGLNRNLSLKISNDEWNNSVESARDTLQLPVDDPNYESELNKLATTYVFDSMSSNFRETFGKQYSCNEDCTNIVKKITENIHTENYNSIELVRAIARGDLK